MSTKILNKIYSIKEIWMFKKSIISILLNPKKIINFIYNNYEWFTKKTNIKSMPYGLMIETTGRCNLKCSMCFLTRYSSTKERTDLSFEDFKDVIDEIGDYLIFVLLWNFGEPLLNKDIFRMVEYAKSKNIVTAITTNLQVLNEKMIKDMINSKLDYLNVSFNGYEETYERNMVGAKFDKVIYNLKMIKDMKKNLPFVDLSCIIMRNNENQLHRIREVGKMYADKISFKTLTISKLNENSKKDIPLNIKYQATTYLLKNNKGKICKRLWMLPLINFDKTMVPCCNDGFFEHKLGVYEKGKFKEVWNNNIYINFRKQILEDIDKIDICKTCSKYKHSTQFVEV